MRNPNPIPSRSIASACRLAAFTLAATGLCSPASATPPVIRSSFDAGAEEWQVVDMPRSHLESPAMFPAAWDAATGNPAGSLRVGDHYYDTGVAAPGASTAPRSPPARMPHRAAA